MIELRQKKILIMAAQAGEIMMTSGAEVYRVEDTIGKICKACNIPYVEVFATPTGIFVSLDSGNDESNVYTYVKRVHGGETDLQKISQINNFSRELAGADLSVEKGMERLRAIDQTKIFPLWVRLLGAAMIASGFSQLFGGTMVDFFCAFLIGTVCYVLWLLLKKHSVHYFVRGFCCLTIGSFLALLSSVLIDQGNYNAMISGILMTFVPGVAITNSIRDFFSGDMVAGLARMAEAFLIAISLAAGAGIALKIWYWVGGGLL